MKKFLNWIAPADVKDKWLYVCYFIILEPLVYTVFGNYVSYFTLNLFFGLGVVGLLLFEFIWNRINKKKFVVTKSISFWFGVAFVLWIFVGGFFSINKQTTFFGVSNGQYVKESVFQFVFYFMFFCAARQTKKCNRFWLTSVMVWMMCFYIVLGFVDYAGVDVPGFISRNSYSLMFYHFNHAGYLAVITATLAFWKFLSNATWKDRIPFVFAFALHSIYFAVNGSLGPIIALIGSVVSTFIFFIARKKWKILPYVAVVFAVFVGAFCFFDFVPKVKDLRTEETPLYAQLVGVAANVVGVKYTYEGKTISGADGWARKPMWKDSIETTLERPLFGTGASTFEDAHPKYGLHNPHNEFLEYSSANGIPALMFYLAFVISILVIGFKRNKAGVDYIKGCNFAIIGYLVSSFFGCTIVCVMPQYFMVLGFASE